MTDEQKYPTREETQKILTDRISALAEGLEPNMARRLLIEIAEEVFLGAYGIYLTDEMKELQDRADTDTTSIQPINGGKAILVSPYGFEVVSEESVGRNDQYRVTLRECTRGQFHNRVGGGMSVGTGKVPHLERGGLFKGYRNKRNSY